MELPVHPGSYLAKNGDHVRIERWHKPAGEGYWLATIEYFPPLRQLHLHYDQKGKCLSVVGDGISDDAPIELNFYDLTRRTV